METVSKVVTVSLPNYLSGLPIPESIGGIFRLSVKDWFHLVPFVGAVSYVSWATYKSFFPKHGRVNFSVDLESSKIVHAYDIEDLGNKTCFCRCWRSKKFPYCDGAHNDHNLETGDNVGPIVVKRKE